MATLNTIKNRLESLKISLVNNIKEAYSLSLKGEAGMVDLTTKGEILYRGKYVQALYCKPNGSHVVSFQDPKKASGAETLPLELWPAEHLILILDAIQADLLRQWRRAGSLRVEQAEYILSNELGLVYVEEGGKPKKAVKGLSRFNSSYTLYGGRSLSVCISAKTRLFTE